jgi:hypothetical protein
VDHLCCSCHVGFGFGVSGDGYYLPLDLNQMLSVNEPMDDLTPEIGGVFMLILVVAAVVSAWL